MKKFSQRLLALLPSVLSAALLVFAISCTDRKANEVFKEPVLERLQEGINSLRTKLKDSPQGWIISYQPSKNEIGYYQFLIRFINDKETEMVSDFSPDDLSWIKSEYSILIGTAVKLSFSTGSLIHKLSNANFSPIPSAAGSGLKGDFEFLYYGENPQGDLVFKTNRTNETLLFKKATDKSFEEIRKGSHMLDRFRFGGNSLYRGLFETKGGVSYISAVSVPYDGRVIQIQEGEQRNINGKPKWVLLDSYISCFGLTPEGLFFDRLTRRNGEALKNVAMKYNPDADQFETALGDGTWLTIRSVTAPLYPIDGQKAFLAEGTSYGAEYAHKATSFSKNITSPDFLNFFEKFMTIGLDVPELANGPTFYLMRRFPLPPSGQAVDFISIHLAPDPRSDNRFVNLEVIYQDKGDRLVISRTDNFLLKSIIPDQDIMERYDDFINFLTDPQGFYVENLGRMTYDGAVLFSFTSIKNPLMRFAASHIPH